MELILPALLISLLVVIATWETVSGNLRLRAAVQKEDSVPEAEFPSGSTYLNLKRFSPPVRGRQYIPDYDPWCESPGFTEPVRNYRRFRTDIESTALVTFKASIEGGNNTLWIQASRSGLWHPAEDWDIPELDDRHRAHQNRRFSKGLSDYHPVSFRATSIKGPWSTDWHPDGSRSSGLGGPRGRECRFLGWARDADGNIWLQELGCNHYWNKAKDYDLPANIIEEMNR